MDCLNTLVGISKDKCQCWDAGREAEYMESTSGYYLTDPVYGLPLDYADAIKDCSYADLWELMLESRETGITHFETDLNAVLRTSPMIRSVPPFTGFLAHRGGGYRIPDKRFVASVFEAHRHLGTDMTVSEVRVETNAPDGTPIQVGVYDSLQLALPTPVAIEILTGTVYNKIAICRVPGGGALTVPMTENDGTPRDIYFVLEDWHYGLIMNKTDCNCGGNPAKSTRWGLARGVKSDVHQGLLTAAREQRNGYGIIPKVTISCSTDFICSDLDPVYSRIVAECIVLYSNRALANQLLISNKVNVFTSARSEELNAKLEVINGQIQERMDWFSENIPEGATDCYQCRARARKRSILV